MILLSPHMLQFDSNIHVVPTNNVAQHVAKVILELIELRF